MKKMLFLVNPVAGTNTIGNKMVPILDMFQKAGYEVTVHISQSGEDVFQTFYRQSGDFDTLVCCGGDGTLNTSTDGLIKSGNKPRFGYIPAGTVNDFATTYHIPKRPVEAAKVIAAGNSKLIDIGSFDGRSFVYVAAFGSIADVSYSTPQKMKNALGKAAYILEGAKKLLAMKPYHAKFTTDDRVIEGDFIYGSLSNSCSIGGFKLPLMRDYRFNDGLMEVLLVHKPQNIAEANRILNVLLTQKPDGEVVTMLQSHTVSYVADEEIPWTLDGEFGGAKREATVTMQKEILDMIC